VDENERIAADLHDQVSGHRFASGPILAGVQGKNELDNRSPKRLHDVIGNWTRLSARFATSSSPSKHLALPDPLATWLADAGESATPYPKRGARFAPDLTTAIAHTPAPATGPVPHGPRSPATGVLRHPRIGTRGQYQV
jgi:hypothetical protein